MSLPRYPEYKPSGVEWLGEVPNHWEILKSRRLFSQRKDRAVETDKQLTASQKLGIVYQADYVALEGQKVVQVITGADMLKHVEPNDFVISMRSFQGGIEWSGLRGSISSAYVMLIPSSPINPNFFRYLFKSGLYIQALQTTTNLVRDGQALRYENFTLVDLPLLPIEEQSAIAAFLDRETGKIDALIAEQRRLVELLAEKRQAAISHSVTKGLNPSAPMKDSGIEWLGEVPAHWKVQRVKSASTFTTSGPRGWSERVGEDGHLFVQSGDLNDSLQVEFGTAKRVLVEDDAEGTRTRLIDGDVVVCITGAKTGNVAVCVSVPEPAYVNQHLCLIRPSQEVLPVFLGMLLKSKIGQTYFELSQYGLKQGLSLEDVREAPVLLPSLTEQQAIAAFLNTETAKFDTLTAEANRAIALLQERRSALISAAVTGKIDVRGRELEEALAETRADLAAGLFVQESAAAHLARCVTD
jgi:type I restriction enzyme S subunit